LNDFANWLLLPLQLSPQSINQQVRSIFTKVNLIWMNSQRQNLWYKSSPMSHSHTLLLVLTLFYHQRASFHSLIVAKSLVNNELMMSNLFTMDQQITTHTTIVQASCQKAILKLLWISQQSRAKNINYWVHYNLSTGHWRQLETSQEDKMLTRKRNLRHAEQTRQVWRITMDNSRR